jgi:methyltransferase (TIGR00027 family)
MKPGHVSRTALNVAGVMVTAGASTRWAQQLPDGLAELSEALLRASGEFPFNRRSMRLAKQPFAVRMAEWGERLQPGSFGGLVRRKIFMNEQVLAAIDAGAGQALVLGAGFDTLCLRLSREFPAIRFFEVDHPDTAKAKQRAVRALEQPENMVMLAADLAQQPLSRVLAENADWNPAAKAIVVAEGLLYYLPRAAVRELFAELAVCSPRQTRVAFSHLFDPYSYRLARAALRVAGEPWLSASATRDLPAYLGPGWQIIVERAGRQYRDLEGLAVAEQI